MQDPLVRLAEEARVREIIENEWLGLGDTTQIETDNPFDNRTDQDIEEPLTFLLKLFSNPDYFYFTCKHIFNKEVSPDQLAILSEMWYRPFPMLVGARGMGKSFILALYAMLRATLCQGTKICIVGAAFRQAKVIFEYCEEIWYNAPILRNICGVSRKNGPRRDVDRCTMRIGDSIITALPLGDGTKIRGQRANIIIADEFASIPVDIYENVVAGFAAVSMSPIEKMKEKGRERARKRLGMWVPSNVKKPKGLRSNQSILSGTAYYGFNHFAEYHKRWKEIIESEGDHKKLCEAFGTSEIPGEFNWRDYSVIRIPVELLPPGFMDEKHVAKARATVHAGIYQMEYGACFSTDSNGFFKRSLIESCVVGNPSTPVIRDGSEVLFNAVLKGNPVRRYAMGIDPASEADNFSIVIVEIWGDHRRIVYCWTTTRKRHRIKVEKGIEKEQNFYGACSSKIRELLKTFPCDVIALDTQGGGVAILEALADTNSLPEGAQPILPLVDPDPKKWKETDGIPGDHIIDLINFAQSSWVAEANHGMRKDFEDKVLLFPMFDPGAVGIAIEDDKMSGRVKVDVFGETERMYDTLEDCVMEIEELKDELATIVHTQTGISLRDRWDTPEVKVAGGKKGRLRKDRYSALLMANMSARVLAARPEIASFEVQGGFAHDLAQRAKEKGSDGIAYIGPDWFTSVANRGGYGTAVRRNQ